MFHLPRVGRSRAPHPAHASACALLADGYRIVAPLFHATVRPGHLTVPWMPGDNRGFFGIPKSCRLIPSELGIHADLRRVKE